MTRKFVVGTPGSMRDYCNAHPEFQPAVTKYTIAGVSNAEFVFLPDASDRLDYDVMLATAEHGDSKIDILFDDPASRKKRA